MADVWPWLIGGLSGAALVLAGVAWSLWHAPPPDTIERFKHWRP